MRDKNSTALRRAREAHRLTLTPLAKRAGISVGRLSMIERGLAPATPAERARIAEAFGLPEAELFPAGERHSG